MSGLWPVWDLSLISEDAYEQTIDLPRQPSVDQVENCFTAHVDP